jgi:DNA-binding winged helix-turn-helix (wHTH) protein/tetratricopeptide (TPR) repeat protein
MSPVALARFGIFELDLETGELHRDGTRVHVQEQPRRVLRLLVRRAGQLVTREELRRAVWSDGTHVDFERGLNFCVSQIRRALGEDAASPLYVETVPRHGYRFVAPVTVRGEVTALPPSPEARREPTPAAPARRMLTAVALGALVLLGSGARRAPVSSEPALETVQARFEAMGALEDAERWVSRTLRWEVPAREAMPRAREAAARALERQESAGAHLVLAQVALRHDWDVRAAQAHLTRALQLEPELAAAHVERAELLLVQGRVDDAVAAVRAALDIDPVCPTVRGQVASVYYLAGRYPEAASSWQRATLVAPHLVGPHERLVHVYRHSAQPDRAVVEAGRVVALLAPSRPPSPPPAVPAFLRGTIRYLTADPRQAEGSADRIAVLHAALGETDEAELWLERAAEAKAPSLPVTLARDPDLAPLLDRPAMRALRLRLRIS